jgi:glyoxylase-like metal-dependent hydrolase (beta-lactamase superfamily II)/rhodanese-related sulfurtransferase
MYFKQFYLGCLAHASYLIGSQGEAVVVDPQRDVDQYLQEASNQGLKILHVIETHLHADFVSGHRELAAKTGAKIYYGNKADVEFEHVPVKDGDDLNVGDVTLRFLETPGHTPESISILVYDGKNAQEPYGVLTGDTLFIGDVGRPDLLGSTMSAAQLAGMLFDSLHGKLLKLPDSVKVFPAHGAGSMCGRNISSETSSTIGEQRKLNYALQDMSRDDFIRMMTADLPEAPSYFSMDAQINRKGPAILEELAAPAPLSPEEIESRSKDLETLILDTRPSDQYGTGHIPGALNIGLSGQFASWAGTLIPLGTRIILVTENEEKARESRLRLARVGHENVVGFLSGGMLSWHNAGLPVATTEQITVDELDRLIQDSAIQQIVDVRRPNEWKGQHISKATHIPLNHLADEVAKLDSEQQTAAICAGGYRSSMATSILERKGFRKIINVIGGMSAWNNAKLPVIAE